MNLTAMISHNFCQNPLPDRFDHGDGLARHDVTWDKPDRLRVVALVLQAPFLTWFAR